MGATWPEVESVLASTGVGTRRSDTTWKLDLPITGTGRSQTVFVERSVLGSGEGSLDIIKVISAITFVTRSDDMAATMPASATALTDLLPVLRGAGGLSIGGLAYTELDDDGGVLAIVNTFVLSLLDLADQQTFLTYLGVLAVTADKIEQLLAGQYGKTSAEDAF